MSRSGFFFLLMVAALLAGCGQTVVKSTEKEALRISDQYYDETHLLDIGVVPFDPGLDNADDDATLLPEVRNAEARFIASRLVETVQRTAAWGAVRVIPAKASVVDVYVEGTILHSDGEKLELSVRVSDSTGRKWYSREYEEIVGKYSYEKRRELQREPFQSLYNRIANDLLDYRRQLDIARVETIRTISEIRFAREFSPDAFDGYIAESGSRKGDGELTLVRLPADSDPQLQRIRKLRERDYLFVDTVQEYYDAFSRRMETPYHEWRANSYEEILAVRELRRQSRNRTIAGVAAIIAGVAVAAESNNAGAQAAGVTAVGAGGLLVKSGLAKRQEAQIHVEALVEMGQSLESEIEPHVIELEDRTVTLTGNVEAQYAQWKELLGEIYRAERGEL
ncbi:MAG: hypothetical protein ACWA5K_05460 [bacterium]